MTTDAHVRQQELILLVEDSPTQALATQSLLEEAGFAVKVSTNGAMAVALVAELEPDLLLLDMHLPDMSGRMIAERLKSNPTLRGIPIIFLTGVFREIEDIIAGLDQGADDYLIKPIDPSELIARVRASLRAYKTQRELGKLARLLLTVSQVGSQLAGILNLDPLLASVVELIQVNFEYPHVHVFLSEAGGLRLAAAAGLPIEVWPDSLLDLEPEQPSLAAASAKSNQLYLVSGESPWPAPHPFLPQMQSGAAAPIHSNGKVSGVLEIASPSEIAFTANDGLVLQTLADMVGVAVHNSAIYQKMEELAMVDELTGLPNRRTTLNRLRLEWSRAQRYKHPLSLVTLDVDQLKAINDEHGHSAADDALRAMATAVAGSVRQTDLAGRLAGDEFVLILPETNEAGAFQLAERVRQAIEAVVVESDGRVPIALTASLGVAAWPETAAGDADSLLRASDAAAYRAKAAGRNTTHL